MRASGHLVAFAELALVCDKHFDDFVDAGIQIVSLRPPQPLYVDDDAFDAVRNAQRRIAHFFRFFTENRI